MLAEEVPSGVEGWDKATSEGSKVRRRRSVRSTGDGTGGWSGKADTGILLQSWGATRESAFSWL